jgi:predicted ATPase
MTSAADPRLRIERLRVENYRVLRDVTFDKLTPLTVLLGPNGSGKSTVFDVFAFLHESFTEGLRRAWDRRNRIHEIRSRGADGPVRFEIKYRDGAHGRRVTYTLAIDEEGSGPVVVEERLQWTIAPGQGRPKDILRFARGEGPVYDVKSGSLTAEVLESPDLLAVSTLGQLSRHPNVAALRRFISGWYLSYLSADSARSVPMAGPQARLSANGDNLPNVIQFLGERHPARLAEIFRVLADRVPSIERVQTDLLADGRLLLQIKDIPFDEPTLSKFASDGTLKLLAYLTVLHDPQPPPIIGIEEPENQLHPRLLHALAEESRVAAERSQLLVTTHSPYFVDAVRSDEVWILYRGEDGYARTVRASSLERVDAMVRAGGQLGDLWMEGYFDVGDPLRRGGLPSGVVAS